MNKKGIKSGILVLAAIFTFGATSSAVTLNVPMIYQETDVWCWAAAAQMAICYHNTSCPAQCSIVDWAWGVSYCCSYPYDQPCYSGNWVTTSNGCLGILWNWGVDASPVYSYISESQVQSEINAGDPFLLHFRWTGGGGHVLTAYGYSSGWVYINDPWYGPISYDYWSAVSASDHWWEETVTTNGGSPEPTPTPTPDPGATCVGYCGGQSPSGCYCDSACVSYGDCCPDYQSACVSPTPTPTPGPTPTPTPGPTPTPTPAPTPTPSPSDSCYGYCGTQAPGGCWCDSYCTSYGDCCADYNTYC